MINARKLHGKYKRQCTDNETLDIIVNLKIPTVANLSDVLGLSRKQSLRRIRRLEAKELARRKKVKNIVYVYPLL